MFPLTDRASHLAPVFSATAKCPGKQERKALRVGLLRRKPRIPWYHSCGLMLVEWHSLPPNMGLRNKAFLTKGQVVFLQSVHQPMLAGGRATFLFNAGKGSRRGNDLPMAQLDKSAHLSRRSKENLGFGLQDLGLVLRSSSTTSAGDTSKFQRVPFFLSMVQGSRKKKKQTNKKQKHVPAPSKCGPFVPAVLLCKPLWVHMDLPRVLVGLHPERAELDHYFFPARHVDARRHQGF